MKLKEILKFIKKHIKLCIFLIIVILIAVAVIKIKNGVKEITDAFSSITTETVEKQTISNYVAMTGTIQANDSQTVYSTQNGLKVTKIFVEVGDEVKAGDVIATLDATEIEENLETAKRQLEVDESLRDLEVKQAQETLSETNVDGLDNWKEGEISVAQANTDLYYAQIDYQRACEDLSQANSDLSYAKQQMEDELHDAKKKEKSLKEERDAIDEATNPAEYAAADSKYKDAKEKRKSLEDKLDDPDHTFQDYYNRIQSAQRNVENANQSIERTQRSVQNAQEKFADSAEDARRRNLDASEALERQNLQASVATDSQEDRVKQLQKQVDECTIVAPISGVVTSVSMEEGDETGADNNSICVIQDVTGFKVEGTVDEYDIAKITEGMKAVIKTEATGDTEMTGVLSFVSPTPVSSTSNSAQGSSSSAATYVVRVTIDELDKDVRIGMTAATSIIIETAEDVLTVPYDCIYEKEDGSHVIYVKDKSDDVEQPNKKDKKDKSGKDGADGVSAISAMSLGKETPVEVGLQTDYYTEISGANISEGMEVYVVGDMEEQLQDAFSGKSGGFGGGPGGGPR